MLRVARTLYSHYCRIRSPMIRSEFNSPLKRPWPTGSVPLLALPVIDLALTVHGSGVLRRALDWEAALRLGMDCFAAACFWIGLFLAARLALQLAERSSAAARVLLRLAAGLTVGAAVLYHLIYWSFIVLNGHPPSPETLVFVLDNAAQIPHHVLQTAPQATLAVGAISAVTAFALMRLARAWLRQAPPPPMRRDVVYAGVMLTAWHVIAGAGSGSIPVSTVLDPDRTADARTNLALRALPPRPDVPLAHRIGGRRPSVVVILVESLRYDLLLTDPEAVPFFRSMYETHTGFSRAYATASHSNLSDLAFWYAQYPLRGPGKERFPRDADWRGVSLFDLFKAHGYQTGYISSQNERWGEMINWLETPSIDHFFHSETYEGETWENYDDVAGLASLIKQGVTHAGKIEDSETLRIAKQWISSLDRGAPFFLGMNLQNTHFSYVLSPGAAQPFQPSDLGFRAVYYRWPQERRVNVRNRYLNSVLNVDQLLHDFADFLRQEGLWDDLVFVVVGDNGEAFYEHGFGNHSGPMYDEVVRTLAFVKPPAGSALPSGEFASPVSHIDIAATIPELAGLPLPWSFQGRPVTSGACTDRPVFMYSNAIVRQYGTVSWPWKYLLTAFPEEQEELYNLEEDPGELSNRERARPDVTARLAESVRAWSAIQQRYYQESVYLEKVPPDHCPGEDAVSGTQPLAAAMLP